MLVDCHTGSAELLYSITPSSTQMNLFLFKEGFGPVSGLAGKGAVFKPHDLSSTPEAT